MDDTTRGVGDERTSGRGGETTRNYAAPEAPARTSSRPATTLASDADDPDQRTREIRAEIEQTRGEMSETIDAIQEKLRPGNVVAEAKERVKSATTERVRQMAGSASETAHNAYEQTRQMAGQVVEGARGNAIPAAMICVGTAWLLFDRYRNSRRSDYRGWRSGSYRTPEYYGSDEYYRSTSGAVYTPRHEDEEPEYSDISSRTRSMAAGVSDTASGLRDRTMRTGRRARNRFQRLLHENPLMVGAAAVVVGCAVGMALPETERENEWLGETRDNVIEKAQDAARDVATRAQGAVGEAAGEVTKKVVSGKE
jgi:ElaB/YqjD/DUF883 family membrane-anchored ribosome-binding protein